MKKYILVPYANLNIGGVPTKIIDIVNTLKTTHPDVMVRILLQNGRLNDQRSLIHNPNVSVFNFSFPLPFGKKIAYILWLWWNIFYFRPISILAFLSPYALPALLAKIIFFFYSVRVIVSEDHYTQTLLKTMAMPWLQKIGIRMLYPTADTIIVPTIAIRQQLEEICRLPKDTIFVVSNWTRFTEIKIHEHTRKWDIIHIGRLVASKNPLRIAQIMAGYVKMYPNTLCAIVGEGDQTNQIKQFIHKHHVDKRITVYSATLDVSMYLCQAKTFLFLPEPETEGFPMVLLEAMACGTIAISEQFKGVDEILKNKENGFVLPISTVTPILIHKAITNSSTVQKNAHSFVKKYCSPKEIYKYILALNPKIKESL